MVPVQDQPFPTLPLFHIPRTQHRPRFGVYRAGTLRAAVHGLPVIAERVAGSGGDRVRVKTVGASEHVDIYSV